MTVGRWEIRLPRYYIEKSEWGRIPLSTNSREIILKYLVSFCIVESNGLPTLISICHQSNDAPISLDGNGL